MENNSLVSIQIVVHNGEKYLRHCLRAAMAQTYPNIEIIVFNNASTDATREIAKELQGAPCTIVESRVNLGMWPGQEEALKHSRGEYVIALSVDVMLDPDFVRACVEAAKADPHIGAIQGKIYQYEYNQLMDASYTQSRTIDTCGFAMTRERKVINVGHGESDGPAFACRHAIFGVEGAAPFFRRSALDDCRMPVHDGGWIWDPDYFWYGDDLDLAWRMTLYGHRQVFVPNAIAWHDRSTTKSVKHTGLLADHVARRALRRAIPIRKRRLDWSNTRFTLIKNDHLKNVLRDAVSILAREINVQGYAGLFEQGILLEWGRFLRLAPRMLARRRIVMARARVTADAVRVLMLADTRELGRSSPSERWWRLLRAGVVALGCAVVIFVVALIVVALRK